MRWYIFSIVGSACMHSLCLKAARLCNVWSLRQASLHSDDAILSVCFEQKCCFLVHSWLMLILYGMLYAMKSSSGSCVCVGFFGACCCLLSFSRASYSLSRHMSA